MAHHRRGFALIIVLIAIASLFALAMPAAVRSRASVIEASVLRQRLQAERNARAAVAIALEGLIPADGADLGAAAPSGGGDGAGAGTAGSGGGARTGDEESGIPDFLKELIPELADIDEQVGDELGEQGAALAQFRANAGLSAAKTRPSVLGVIAAIGLPTRPVGVELDGQRFELAFADGGGRLNINEASADQLRRYFVALGVDGATARRIGDQAVDWRDDDGIPGANGAEQDAYDRLGVVCRDAPFASIDELLFLPSMTPEVLDRARADLTTIGDGKVHVGGASREVLLSLPNASPEVVDDLIRARREGPISKQDLDRLIPAIRRDMRDLLRVQNSSVVRIDVRAAQAATGATVGEFVAYAFLGDGGVSEVAVLPRDRRR